MSDGASSAWRRGAVGVAIGLAVAASVAACVLSTEGQRAAGLDADADAAVPDAAPRDDGGGRERCENDLDDDGNGLVDCADPACAADYECVETPPDGWEGPLFLREVAFDEPATPCAGGVAPRSHGQGDASTVTCAPCACGALADAACSPPPLHCYYGVAGCSGGQDDDLTGAANDAGCLTLPAQGVPSSCMVTGAGAVASEGACPPTGGAIASGPPVPRRIDDCRGPMRVGGCEAGRVCAHKPATGYGVAGVCVQRPGNHGDCPLSFDETRFVAWQDVVDGRVCSPCRCTASGASCAGGAYTIHGCPACSPDVTCGAVSLPAGYCYPTSGLLLQPWSVAATPPALTAGGCTASGGEADGAVLAEGEITFCCKR